VGSTVGFTVGLAVGTMLPTLHSIRTLPSSFVVGATLGAIVLLETLKVLLVNVMLLSSGDVEVTNCTEQLVWVYSFLTYALKLENSPKILQSPFESSSPVPTQQVGSSAPQDPLYW